MPKSADPLPGSLPYEIDVDKLNKTIHWVDRDDRRYDTGFVPVHCVDKSYLYPQSKGKKAAT